MKKLRKGFTLIELLVVIAIIAILATVVILNVIGARAKAARAKVSADMNVASKVAAACASFDGTLYYGVVTLDTGTMPVPIAAANKICNTINITDATEKTAATGNWPVFTAASQFFYTQPTSLSTPNLMNVVVKAPNGGKLTCGLTGCTSDGTF